MREFSSVGSWGRGEFLICRKIETGSGVGWRAHKPLLIRASRCGRQHPCAPVDRRRRTCRRCRASRAVAASAAQSSAMQLYLTSPTAWSSELVSKSSARTASCCKPELFEYSPRTSRRKTAWAGRRCRSAPRASGPNLRVGRGSSFHSGRGHALVVGLPGPGARSALSNTLLISLGNARRAAINREGRGIRIRPALSLGSSRLRRAMPCADLGAGHLQAGYPARARVFRAVPFSIADELRRAARSGRLGVASGLGEPPSKLRERRCRASSRRRGASDPVLRQRHRAQHVEFLRPAVEERALDLRPVAVEPRAHQLLGLPRLGAGGRSTCAGIAREENFVVTNARRNDRRADAACRWAECA